MGKLGSSGPTGPSGVAGINIKEQRKAKLKEIGRKWYHNKMRVFSLCCLLFYALLFKGCVDYNWNNKTEVTIIDKMESSGRNHSSYYLIMKDTKGRVFDQYVSPATYSQSKINTTYYMDLREMDIKQTPTKNLLFFIMPIILICAGLGFFIGSFIKIEL